MARRRGLLLCLPIGACLLSPSAAGQEGTSDSIRNEGFAESIVAREEAQSGRAFDPAFRAWAKTSLGALPAILEGQAGEDGLGLSALGDSQADLVYTPVTPCRILDTRIAGGALPAGTTRSFLVTGTDLSVQGGKATGCGVPYGPATAAVVNLVAVSPAGPGNLRITPFGTAMPLASIINYAAVPGLAIANGPAVAMCDPAVSTCSADITIQADVSAVDLVADVQGYYRRVMAGGVGTALLADGAVTAPKIGTGAVVRSLNSQRDAVTLAGTNGLSVSAGSGTVTVASNATASNTTGAIVARDASGNFSAGSVGLAGNLNLQNTASASVGVLTKGGTRFLHSFGANNTFVGGGAGNFTLTGSNNSAFGTGALVTDTTGNGNSAFGSAVLYANTTGAYNSAFGASALASNTTGIENAAVGYRALYANTTGVENSAFGNDALNQNTTGSYNVAFGHQALEFNTVALYNSAFGYRALRANTTGLRNTAVGAGSLENNTTGAANSAFGWRALQASTTANDNSAFGYQALEVSTTASGNCAFGAFALQNGSIPNNNVAIGWGALRYLTGGGGNIAIGAGAGNNLTSGSSNIYIGSEGVAGDQETIRIGGVRSAAYIGGIWGQTSASGAAVFINSSNKLGTITSSRRYKEQIVDMSTDSDVLLKLRPVSFYYRPELDETHLRQYGLVAEEVAEVAPGLVAYDQDGAPQTVRYHFVNAMLLNEVQKQRRLLEAQHDQLRAQEAEIFELRAQQAVVEELKQRLARLEARRPR